MKSPFLRSSHDDKRIVLIAFLLVLFLIPVEAGFAAALSPSPGSFPLPVMIQKSSRNEISWAKIIDGLANDLRANLKIRLHTMDGQTYNNQSNLTYKGDSSPIGIPKIEYSLTGMGSFQFLINDINMDAPRLAVSKDQCQLNQLALDIYFEEQGIEVKGYGTLFNPDFEVSAAAIKMILGLSFQSGKLSCAVDQLKLTGDVKAVNSVFGPAATFIASQFSSSLAEQCRDAFNMFLQNTAFITKILLNIILDQTGLLENQIGEILFTTEGLKISPLKGRKR